MHGDGESRRSQTDRGLGSANCGVRVGSERPSISDCDKDGLAKELHAVSSGSAGTALGHKNATEISVEPSPKTLV